MAYILILEQNDGFRVELTVDDGLSILYMKKEKGWTRELAEEIVNMLPLINSAPIYVEDETEPLY